MTLTKKSKKLLTAAALSTGALMANGCWLPIAGTSAGSIYQGDAAMRPQDGGGGSAGGDAAATPDAGGDPRDGGGGS